MTNQAQDKIAEKLRYLKASLAKLEKFRSLSEVEYQADERNEYTVERLFQTVLEAAIDIARLVIIEQNLIEPGEQRAEFSILSAHDVLPSDLAQRLDDAKKFRNVLVHEYISVDPVKVQQHLQQDLGDLQQFSQLIAAHIQPNSHK